MDQEAQASALSRMEMYFRRFGYCGRQIATPPAPDLGLVIVMPCFNEPDLVGALEALWRCERPAHAVEVIVVINGPEGGAEDIRRQNEISLAQGETWAAEHLDPRLVFHFIYCPDLPLKHAGVGLARKIGMDEALRRLLEAGNGWDGIIAGFDADCRCAPNYPRALEAHFQQHPDSPGCGIYFEHPLEGSLPASIYGGIAEYELHLRYYVRALRYAGFPHAFHTIGSCMAVRAEAYLKQGGMNRRQAGEDFYFLHKIITLGGFTELSDTTVYPSPRASERVPFGTGKAMGEVLAGGTVGTYPLEVFQALKCFFEQVPALYRRAYNELPDLAEALPEPVRTFLAQQRWLEALGEIRSNTTTEAAFRKRFFRWFDGFQTMKCLNYARDQVYGRRPVAPEAQRLLALLPNPGQWRPEMKVNELLAVFRELDRYA